MTNDDLNLDNISDIEIEKALSNSYILGLKKLYSPEMEERELSSEERMQKKAIINAIVDISNNPQKIKKENTSNIINLNRFSNGTFSNNENTNTLSDNEKTNFIITPQQIADEIY